VNSFHLPMDKKVKDLSRGMQTKLMLAVAILHEVKLLILDEPTQPGSAVLSGEYHVPPVLGVK
jgi:ABC-type uncharacterized transport system ATPase subunit